MNRLCTVLISLFLASAATAQSVDPSPVINPVAPSGSMTLGGVPQLIANKLLEAKPCGLVDFDGHIGGGAYVPTWTFHDMNGTSYVEVGDIGYRSIQGSKPSILLMPAAVDITSISGRMWNFQWANNHVTRSKYPDMFLGPTALLPLDGVQIRQLKLKNYKDWLGAVASIRFK